MKIQSQLSVSDRRKAMEKKLKKTFPSISISFTDENLATTRHCENMIGSTHVPLGVAGPLTIIDREPKKTTYYVPLATTEGALVASVNRGCKAIFESGGACVGIERIGATRGPVFAVSHLKDANRLNTFFQTNIRELQDVAAQTSRHILLKKISSVLVGHYVYARFVFDTEDAMGLNMVTIATDAIARSVEEKLHIHCVALSGNYCVDKKPAYLNAIEGRGRKVWAEITIPEKILRSTLKTTAKQIYDVWISKCMLGSIMSGSLAHNAQFANIVAALFLATGQDIAHVVEGAMGVTTCEVVKKDLYVSVYMPDLMVGTVGGGTELATQKEALELLGIYGGNEGKYADKLAKIVSGAVLAGELSLLASLSEGTLAQAHKRLARGK